ncbi:MAG: class C sortase [Clostridiales bacterium]|nr:class C sortase [Clostridiales bacterium]
MNKKTGFRIKLAIFIAITAAGLIYASIPLFKRIATERSIAKEIEKYNEVIQPEEIDYSPVWEMFDSFNASLLENEMQFVISDEQKAAVEEISGMTNDIVGIVDIPGEDIRLPIYIGLAENNLQSGAAWWTGSSLPAGGPGTHTVISAHSGLAKAKMFTDLDRMKTGDLFSVSFLDRTMYYEVDQIKTVLPDDVSDLYIIPGEDHVTLYTCTPYGVNTHRLLVRGKRIDAPEIREPARITGEAVIDKTVIFLISFSCVTIILLTILSAVAAHKSKKNRKENGGG